MTRLDVLNKNMPVLLQYGADAYNTRFEDSEGKTAFTVAEVSSNPNPVVRVARDTDLSNRVSGLFGPEKAYLYFGPSNSPGQVVYGNNRDSIPMMRCLRQHRHGSTSRYFTTQNGKDLKWRFVSHKMELVEGRSTIAVWELSDPEADYHARLTITKQSGLAVITEILTVLTLIRIAKDLTWF